MAVRGSYGKVPDKIASLLLLVSNKDLSLENLVCDKMMLYLSSECEVDLSLG